MTEWLPEIPTMLNAQIYIEKCFFSQTWTKYCTKRTCEIGLFSFDMHHNLKLRSPFSDLSTFSINFTDVYSVNTYSVT